jgi:hypothetical protein
MPYLQEEDPKKEIDPSVRDLNLREDLNLLKKL